MNASNHVITTFAGNGTADYSGDGGPATAATLLEPTGIALGIGAAAAHVYIADSRNNRVRVVSLT